MFICRIVKVSNKNEKRQPEVQPQAFGILQNQKNFLVLFFILSKPVGFWKFLLSVHIYKAYLNDSTIVEPKLYLTLISLASPPFAGRYFAKNVHVESDSP